MEDDQKKHRLRMTLGRTGALSTGHCREKLTVSLYVKEIKTGTFVFTGNQCWTR